MGPARIHGIRMVGSKLGATRRATGRAYREARARSRSFGLHALGRLAERASRSFGSIRVAWHHVLRTEPPRVPQRQRVSGPYTTARMTSHARTPQPRCSGGAPKAARDRTVQRALVRQTMPRAWEYPAPLVLAVASAGTVLCVAGLRSLAFGFPAATASAASMRRPFRPPVDIFVCFCLVQAPFHESCATPPPAPQFEKMPMLRGVACEHERRAMVRAQDANASRVIEVFACERTRC